MLEPTQKQGYSTRLKRWIARGCLNCPWARLRGTVPFEGPEEAKVAIVGRNPGKQEIVQKRPFYSDAPGGGDLNEFLDAVPIDRTLCWVTNAVKCQGGPTDEAPGSHQYTTCAGFLMSELCLIQPRLIITLGNDAMRSVAGVQGSCLTKEGQLVPLNGTQTSVFILSHPGYWLRQPGHKIKVMEQMVPRLREVLDELDLTEHVTAF